MSTSDLDNARTALLVGNSLLLMFALTLIAGAFARNVRLTIGILYAAALISLHFFGLLLGGVIEVSKTRQQLRNSHSYHKYELTDDFQTTIGLTALNLILSVASVLTLFARIKQLKAEAVSGKEADQELPVKVLADASEATASPCLHCGTVPPPKYTESEV